MTPVAIIENSPFLGRHFEHFLDAGGVQSKTFSVWRGERFPGNGYGAYILTGDLHSVVDGLKKYHRLELEFLEYLKDGKVYASCFAHQLIARWKGGEVRRRTSRLFGWEELRVVAGHPALEPDSRYSVLCVNSDEVSTPPAEARVIASSENCEFQMLSYGDSILTCQAHPELTLSRSQNTIKTLALMAGSSAVREVRKRQGLPDDRDSERFMGGVISWLTG